MDGWINPSTGEKHICILLQPLALMTDIFFVKSMVVNGALTADALNDFLKLMIKSLEEHEFSIIGIVGDNACTQQSGADPRNFLTFAKLSRIRTAPRMPRPF